MISLRPQRGEVTLPVMLATLIVSSSTAYATPTVQDLLRHSFARASTHTASLVVGKGRHHAIVISITQVKRIARQSAAQMGVDPALVQAVIANESDYDPNAVSKTGAKGLMQLSTDAASDCRLAGDSAFEPRANILCGTRLLGSLLHRFSGRLVYAVAAYNAGPVAVERFGGTPPYAETQRYVAGVLATYHRYSREQ